MFPCVSAQLLDLPKLQLGPGAMWLTWLLPILVASERTELQDGQFCLRILRQNMTKHDKTHQNTTRHTWSTGISWMFRRWNTVNNCGAGGTFWFFCCSLSMSESCDSFLDRPGHTTPAAYPKAQKSDDLFSWPRNTGIFYVFHPGMSPISGRKIEETELNCRRQLLLLKPAPKNRSWDEAQPSKSRQIGKSQRHQMQVFVVLWDVVSIFTLFRSLTRMININNVHNLFQSYV